MGAQGTSIIDFGPFLSSSSQAQVAVTGQSAITSTSLCEAWLFPSGTIDHSIEEHVIENINVIAGVVTASSGFTIFAESKNSKNYGQWCVAWVWNFLA